MADFVPIVAGLGGPKNCGLCGKQVSLGDTTKQTNLSADGITLTSNPPLHMHSDCLRDTLLWAAKSREGFGGNPLVPTTLTTSPPMKAHAMLEAVLPSGPRSIADAPEIPQAAAQVPGVAELSPRPLPVKGTPPEVQG